MGFASGLSLALRHSKSREDPEASAGCSHLRQWAIRQGANMPTVIVVTPVVKVDTQAERRALEKLVQQADQDAVRKRCS